MIVYLDGLPPESWYKLSVHQFIEELAEEEDRLYRRDVKSLIFAQLHGQSIEAEVDDDS